ncbi:type I-E CRISPR-associated protein Cas5/CasD [Corynebacterium lowii]|uniref:CRISPR system Cascade subunit CasD n=1 Tax=Corynebacterium lowii TaxID=1544413 RepID=A0A0Q0U5B1_9CORY|nr:type I-E CRISPR-associated protein Cas5/CasD [Corynebacterium lowii]KQB87180.1 CRISPR system Cascade subunit CasD [Corynebacterium lowii]MDP9852233.1 CRISPR system Cascade subunit CasD [Corynebacterium lowii]
MPSLLLKLKGPMQSWGDRSRYKIRATGQVPTKSGVIGLLAAAQGRRRTDPVEDLAELTFAVRVDQPGNLLKDYQTAQRWQENPKAAASLVTRYYLSDALFVAAVESPRREVLEGLEEALRRPRFPLFLGRRSCPAPPDLVIGVREGSAVEELRALDWQASDQHKEERSKQVTLPIYRDGAPGEVGVDQRDVPLSFSQEHRRYAWRTVVEEPGVKIDNPEGRSDDSFWEAVVSA